MRQIILKSIQIQQSCLNVIIYKYTDFFVLLLNKNVYFFWYMTPYHWYGYELESSQQQSFNIQRKTWIFQLIETKEASGHMYYYFFQMKPLSCFWIKPSASHG